MANFVGFWVGQLDRVLQGIGDNFNFDIDLQQPDGHIEGRFRNSSEEETDISGQVEGEFIQFTVTYGTDVYCFNGTQENPNNPNDRTIAGLAPEGACDQIMSVRPVKMRGDDASWDAEARNPPMDRQRIPLQPVVEAD